MNTSFPPGASAPSLPEMHLIVAPPGHEADLDQLLNSAEPDSVLAWRVAAGYVRRLTDDELDPAMATALQQGHTVVVWHGHDGCSLQSLQQRLGTGYSPPIQRLWWAQLALPAGARGTQVWSVLRGQLNTPDEADLRLYLQSGGTEAPRWAKSDLLNEQQGLKAFDAWVAQHLAPALEAWHEEDEHRDQDSVADNGVPAPAEMPPWDDEAPVNWPWQDGMAWTAEQWLSQQQMASLQTRNEPANQPVFRLQAAALGARTAGQETISAFLHPVSTNAPSAASAPVSVSLSRSAAKPDEPYQVKVHLPDGIHPDKAWCLWLHLPGSLPLALSFSHEEGRSTLPWSKVRPASAESQACESLWQAIKAGGISLDKL